MVRAVLYAGSYDNPARTAHPFRDVYGDGFDDYRLGSAVAGCCGYNSGLRKIAIVAAALYFYAVRIGANDAPDKIVCDSSFQF